jgi:hypothetical protein
MNSERTSAFFSNHRQEIHGAALLLFSIALAAIGQYFLTSAALHPRFWEVNTWGERLAENSTPLTGLMIYGIAGFIFIKAINFSAIQVDNFAPTLSTYPDHPPRFGFWVASIGLSILTTVFMSISDPLTNGVGYFLAGSLSVYMFVISVFFQEKWRLTGAREWVTWARVHSLEILWVILIVMAGFFLRFKYLENLPYSFINDEGQMGQNGTCLVRGLCPFIMETGWSQQPMTAFLPTGISAALLGNTAVAVRLVSVLIGTLAILAVYLFAREVFDPTTASIASILLALLPYHNHFSRLGVDNIMDSLAAPAILWLLYRGYKRGSIFAVLFAGIISGMSFYTYPGTRLAPVIGIAAAGYGLIFNYRQLRNFQRQILIFSMAFLVTAGPILGFFATHPESFSARINSVGIFQPDNFKNEMAITGHSAVEVISLQFMKSSLVFIATSAPSNFFNSPKPYLVPILAVFFMLGLAYTAYRIKDPRFFGLMIWFWAAILFGSTITGGPPTSQRMLMSSPALVIITAVGLVQVSKFFPKNVRILSLSAQIFLILVVAVSGFQNIQFYFNEYRVGNYFEDPTDEFTYETRLVTAPLHNQGRAYLVTDPGVPYLSFASLNYFSPDVEKSYFYLVTPQELASLPKDRDALFVATASHNLEIDQLAALIPGGERTTIYRKYHPDQVLYISYKITRQSLQGYQP